MNPALNSGLNSAVNGGMAPVATPWFFYVLAGLAVFSGLLVITRRNAVHSALALIVTLLAVTGLYLMLYAPFVAAVQIFVYAGGIMLLFLFVIMLVNIERSSKDRQFNRMWPVGLAAACALLVLVVSVFVKGKALFPDRMMFGSDAFPFGEAVGAEETFWLAARSARTAVAAALAELVSEGAFTETKALELARMYLHDNAAKLYGASQ